MVIEQPGASMLVRGTITRLVFDSRPPRDLFGDRVTIHATTDMPNLTGEPESVRYALDRYCMGDPPCEMRCTALCLPRGMAVGVARLLGAVRLGMGRWIWIWGDAEEFEVPVASYMDVREKGEMKQ